MGRTQSRSCYGNICCGVDGRGSMSLGLKRAASNADRSAPSVGTNGRGGISLCQDLYVNGLHAAPPVV